MKTRGTEKLAKSRGAGHRRLGRYFTMVEMLVVMTIFMILATIIMPSLSEARQRAKFTRWYAYNRACSNDPDALINFNFQDGAGANSLYNSAGASGTANGLLRRRGGGNHQFEWKQGGRWGKYKTALQYNGTDTYVEVPTSMSINFTPNDSFTMYLWVKFDNNTFGNRALINKAIHGSPASAQYTLYTGSSGGNDVINSDVFMECRDWKAEGDDSRFPTGFDVHAWNQIGIRYDASSGEMVAFVNGQPLGAAGSISEEDRNDTNVNAACYERAREANLLLGGLNMSNKDTVWNNYIFRGAMDEFIMYGRALSDSEIRDHYLMGVE